MSQLHLLLRLSIFLCSQVLSELASSTDDVCLHMAFLYLGVQCLPFAHLVGIQFSGGQHFFELPVLQ